MGLNADLTLTRASSLTANVGREFYLCIRGTDLHIHCIRPGLVVRLIILYFAIESLIVDTWPVLRGYHQFRPIVHAAMKTLSSSHHQF